MGKNRAASQLKLHPNFNHGDAKGLGIGELTVTI
jgi:hypothetical protein